jgi:hypothetical protein
MPIRNIYTTILLNTVQYSKFILKNPENFGKKHPDVGPDTGEIRKIKILHIVILRRRLSSIIPRIIHVRSGFYHVPTGPGRAA